MDVEINNVIYMELNLGPKISNGTCGKTINVETIDRDSTVHGFNDVRQTELHPAETLVPEPSAFEVQLTIEKLKRYTSPSIEQIPAELFKADSETIQSGIRKLIISIWNMKELPEDWKQ